MKQGLGWGGKNVVAHVRESHDDMYTGFLVEEKAGGGGCTSLGTIWFV